MAYSTTDTSGTWRYWTSNNCYITATNSTSSATSIDDSWHYWTQDNSSNSTTATIKVRTDGTWQYWVADNPYKVSYMIQQMSKEELRASEERAKAEAKKRRIEQEKQMREREQANKKAWTLFRKALTAKQLEQFEKNKCIDVDGQSGKKYQIETTNYAQNIYELNDKGKRIRRICAHIQHSENCPIGDHLLAQKLHLELAEEDFLKTANKWELN